MESKLPEVTKSPSDQREYKVIELKNKMRCLLISDSEADMSACAVNVHVGASLDPKHIPGVAHFLEHMLFQGSEKYPGTTSYKTFIKKSAGSCNASTNASNTCFKLTVSNTAFEEALDRISQFFIAPSFTESATEKEMNAVDSEFKMKYSDDARIHFIMKKAISNPEGPFCNFQTGNL